MGPLTPSEPFFVFPEYHRCSAGNRTRTIRWSPLPHLPLLGDGSHVQCHDSKNPLWWNGYSVVRPDHQPVHYLSVSEWAEHNRNKRLLQTCYTLKKQKRKNSPSLGTNAPGQLNSHHLASYSTNKLKKKKKKNIEKKKKVKTTYFVSPDLNSTCMEKNSPCRK